MRVNVRIRNLEQSWKEGYRLLTCSLLTLVLAGCGENSLAPDELAVEEIAPSPMSWHQDSWREVIPESCQAFSDGCNTCTRGEPGTEPACTLRACVAYTEPVCLDEQVAQTPEATSPAVPEPRTFRFTCEGGNTFIVFYDLYVADDQRMRLTNDQLMFSDAQTHTATLMTRERSASGARYRGGDLEFWEHGSEATVLLSGEPLYSQCKEE